MAYAHTENASNYAGARAPAREHSSATAVLTAGVATGLIGGMAMGLFAMIRAAAVGLGFWLPMKLISATWMGVPALLGDAGTIALGMATHFATAIGWATLFAALVRNRVSAPANVGLGLLYGTAVWAIMVYAFMPAFNQTFFDRQAMLPVWFFSYHLVFGACLGLVPAIIKRQTLPRDRSQSTGPFAMAP